MAWVLYRDIECCLPKLYLANLMAIKLANLGAVMHFITSHIFLFLETEPRALHMLDTLPLNHMPSPLSISLPCDIMALMDSGLRPSGDEQLWGKTT